MFEALNTTGEPLTAFETFKPRVIHCEGLEAYENSKSREYSGFAIITNNATYSGATTATLQINNAPGSYYGYQYRCNVAGNFSTTNTHKFINTWKGTASNLRNNPANWSCNALPDANTDVIISAGMPVLNVNGVCRSIAVSAGASFTANTGFALQVIH